jgi:hypothetical protein
MPYEMIGLREDNPQGWLAAVGVLYILHKVGTDALMSWKNGIPVIADMSGKEVIASLNEYLERGSDLLENLPHPPPGEEKIALDITAGRVSFTSVIETMIKTINRASLVKALEQVWNNSDNITSLGWDTGALKMAASIGGMNAPDSSPHRGVLAGQWLAAESLPVTGTGSRENEFRWVTWSVPLDLGAVRSLILAQSCDWEGKLYSSKIGRNGQMGYLRFPRTIAKQ